jgi:molybdenum cofactor cytidylyltransferase
MPIESDVPVAVVVLAAGASVRMGAPKLLLALDGETLLERAVGRAAAAGAEQVVVVVPRDAADMRALLAPLGVTVVEPLGDSTAMSASLHAGIGALKPEVTSAVIVLADMIDVSTEMVRQVVAAARQPGAPLVVSRYRGIQAPPLAVPRRYFAEVLAMHGEGVGKAILARHEGEALWLDWPPGAHRDVDTPDDYRAIITTQ